MDISAFWNEFLQQKALSPQTTYFECFHFDRAEPSANELLRLVLCGQKKATASSLLAFEVKGEPIPKVGDYSIVTDWDGLPHCVIETTAVYVMPFCDITYALCKLEGEDDTLASWQKNHRKFFTAEGADLGYHFSETMPVVFEEFQMVYQK